MIPPGLTEILHLFESMHARDAGSFSHRNQLYMIALGYRIGKTSLHVLHTSVSLLGVPGW